ncbi:hypothetical protein AX774_g5836, partial [Zancudomyces culisetae]
MVRNEPRQHGPYEHETIRSDWFR